MHLLSNHACSDVLSQQANNYGRQGTYTRCSCWRAEKSQMGTREQETNSEAQTPALPGPRILHTAAPHCCCYCCHAFLQLQPQLQRCQEQKPPLADYQVCAHT